MKKPRIPTETPTPNPGSEAIPPETVAHHQSHCSDPNHTPKTIDGCNTANEKYRQDGERPLTAKDFDDAIRLIRFAISHGGLQLQVSKNKSGRIPVYSLSDVEAAIDIFTKMSKRDSARFHFQVLEGGVNLEKHLHHNSISSYLNEIKYSAFGTEMQTAGLIAFFATFIHGAPLLKKHSGSKTKEMKRALRKFKLHFELDSHPDYFFEPLIDLALYARDKFFPKGGNHGR